ncbi:MAG: iron-containing alcohol dehydrogenase [Bacteroidales bacterium]|nr:iron-containing alcohol dehydrogenase [Bacteroidales bacterium]
MNNFSFQNPTKIIFGKGTIAQLSTEIPIDKRVMISFGGGSAKRNGIYEQVMDALKNHFIVEFWGIEANPEYETLLKAVSLAKEKNVNFLLAVGGGSVLDGTKFISQAMLYEGEPWDIVKNPALAKPSYPVAAVMTMPATGSEMNHRCVVSYRAKKEKLAFMSRHLFPIFSILDPEVAYSLPKKQLTNGIVDSFLHVMEQYMTYPANALLMDRWAEGILQTIIEVGPKVIANPSDYDLMSNYMLCATMALNEFISMGVPQDWATHRVGQELTALYELDHGQTLAILYPALLQVLRKEKHEKLLQYADRVWGIRKGSEEERVDAVIAKTEEFFKNVGMRTRFHEYGIGEEAVEAIAERVRMRGMAYGEHKSVTPDLVREIVKLAL